MVSASISEAIESVIYTEEADDFSRETVSTVSESANSQLADGQKTCDSCLSVFSILGSLSVACEECDNWRCSVCLPHNFI